jgi:HprK-related kinase B
MINIPVDTCANLTASLRKRFPTRHRLFLAFDGCSFEIRISNRILLEKLYRYYRPFVAGSGPVDVLITIHQADVDISAAYTTKMPESGKTKIKEEFVDLPDGRIVRKRLTRMLFVFGGMNNLAIGPCTANDNQVVNFINNRFIEWKLKRGCLLGHAAGVMHNDRGLALAGFSGMGKSTLALHLMTRGTNFVSNDRLMVKNTTNDCVTMCGVAKLPRVNPGTVLNNENLTSVIPAHERQRFSRLFGEDLWSLEHKYDVDIERCYGPERFILSAPLDILVILNWRRNNSPVQANRVTMDERPDLLPAFMKETGLFYSPADHEPHTFPAESYLELLREVTVIELSGGVDFGRGADICMDFLDKG